MRHEWLVRIDDLPHRGASDAKPVIIERGDHWSLAVMKPAHPLGRNITECIALAKLYESKIDY